MFKVLENSLISVLKKLEETKTAQDTEQIRPATDQFVDINSNQVEEISKFLSCLQFKSKFSKEEQEQIPDTTQKELQKEIETKMSETWEVIEEKQADTQVEQQEAKAGIFIIIFCIKTILEGSDSQQEQEAEEGENKEEIIN